MGKSSKAKSDRSKATPLPHSNNSRALQIVLPALIAISTFIAFLPTLKNGFLAWDDVDNFVNNMDFRGLGWKQISWMFTTYRMGPYQPLSWFTSAIDFTLWDMNPAGYHFTNVLLHSLNGVLFYFLTQRILSLAFNPSAPHPTPSPKGREEGEGGRILFASAFAALFFSIHPLRVESVAWATERRDVLSGLFFLGSGFYYLKRWDAPEKPAEETTRYWISVGLFLLALLSKATAVGLIWALVALDLYPLRRLPLDPKEWFDKTYWPVWREKIPFVLLGAAAVVNGVFGLNEVIGHYNLIERLSFFFYGAVFYVQKTAWPGSLQPLYELPYYFQTMQNSFLICAILALAITGVLISFYKRFPAGLIAWACYLLTFTPVSGLTQNGPQLVAARYSYLACMPWAILLGGFLVNRKTLWLPMGAVLCALGWMSWTQTQLWRDDATLWGNAIALDPDNSRAQNNYGAALMKSGKMDEAAEHYQKSLDLNPSLAEAYRDMGLVLANRGKLDEAIADYKKAEELRPNLPEVHTNLAAVYYQQGKLDDAVEHYRKALDLHTPHVAETNSNLALALMLQGKTDQAIPYYKAAEQLRPELPQIHNNLASALAKAGQKEEAISEARQAIQLNPNYAKAHFLLGNLLKESGQTAEGNEHLQKAAQLGLGRT